MSSWFRATVSELPRTFWYLWLATLINRIGIFVLPFLTLYLTSQRGLSAEEATFTISLFGVGAFASQFVGGYTTDRFGRRSTMLASMFVTPVILIILMDAQDIALINFSTLAFGFFSELYRPASSAIIADVVPPQHHARAFNLRYWAINLGAAIGLALGGLLAQQNYQLLFWGDAITTFLYGLVILFFVPETKPKQAARSTAEVKALKKTGGSLLQREGRLLWFAILFAGLLLVSNSIYRQISGAMPLAMRADGFSDAEFGAVSALNGVIIVLLSLSLNSFMERYSRFFGLAISVALIGFGFGVYAFADSLAWYAIGLVIWTIGEIINAPLGPVIMADLAPAHRRGFYQGLIGASFGLAGFIGPALGGVLYSIDDGTTLWIVCAISGALSGVALYVIARPMYERLKRQSARTVQAEISPDAPASH